MAEFFNYLLAHSSDIIALAAFAGHFAKPKTLVRRVADEVEKRQAAKAQ